MGESSHRLAAALAAVVLVVACGRAPGPAAGPETGGEAAGRREVRLLVFAAASLTDVFGELVELFEERHPGVAIDLSFAGSSSLAVSILEGAPADVFASASEATMARVVAGGESAGAPRVFARNALEIAVPAGNPAGVTGLADFARPDLLIGLCARQVPCGAFARRALEEAGVAPSIDTAEPSVRALLTKLEVGELDAGLVYRTDVGAAGGRVTGIPIPEELNAPSAYPIVRLRHGEHPAAGEAFVELVLSAEGQGILGRWGFLAP
jgi:molybdate transport system substrate-binding protein